MMMEAYCDPLSSSAMALIGSASPATARETFKPEVSNWSLADAAILSAVSMSRPRR